MVQGMFVVLKANGRAIGVKYGVYLLLLEAEYDTRDLILSLQLLVCNLVDDVIRSAGHFLATLKFTDGFSRSSLTFHFTRK